MEYQTIKAIASFNEHGEVQPLYFKLRHHDVDITLKVLYSREVERDEFYISPGKTYKTICEHNGRKHELTVMYDAKSTIWKLNVAQLIGI